MAASLFASDHGNSAIDAAAAAAALLAAHEGNAFDLHAEEEDEWE